MPDDREPDPYEKRADWRPVGVDILSLPGPASGEIRQRRMSVLAARALFLVGVASGRSSCRSGCRGGIGHGAVGVGIDVGAANQ